MAGGRTAKEFRRTVRPAIGKGDRTARLLVVALAARAAGLGARLITAGRWSAADTERPGGGPRRTRNGRAVVR
ncbi:hypothetical protein B7767_25495, partial [Streptomyces sp. 13-12-16]|uniref:hypothetical protein n=1 Tax=Streptomyces sp. 13-12-16 TaxID=1570823 RepID=UPI000A24CE7C